VSINIAKLEKVKHRGGKVIARCPACAENGADKSGEHLVVYEDGRGAVGCVAYPENKPHRARIFELVGDGAGPTSAPAISNRAPVRRGAPEFPRLYRPTIPDLSAIQQNRGFPLFAGLQIAANAGHLCCADMRDGAEVVRAWIVTDSARRNAQARRMDGKLWVGINAKAKTLRGSEAAWPIGAADIGGKPYVALCEGGPDFLTAYFLAWWHGRAAEVAPVAMLGAGQRIHAEALPLFKGKHVRICPHRDEAGQRARGVWTDQLRGAGAASVHDFDCSPDKDLNDVVVRCTRDMEDAET